MRIFSFVATSVAALTAGAAAEAHPGHLAEAAGHWLGAAAIGAAIAIGLWAGLKGRKGEAPEAEAGDEDTDAEPREA